MADSPEGEIIPSYFTTKLNFVDKPFVIITKFGKILKKDVDTSSCCRFVLRPYPHALRKRWEGMG
jgi:hypothetical protein